MQVDHRFHGFDLAKEKSPRAGGIPPVAQKLASDRRCPFVFAVAPFCQVLAQFVDQWEIAASKIRANALEFHLL